MAQLSLTWEPLWVSEIPIRVHCLLDSDWVAFTLVGVNADPILNDFVISRVLVSVVDVTQITPTEVGVHQVMLSFLVTWLLRRSHVIGHMAGHVMGQTWFGHVTFPRSRASEVPESQFMTVAVN